MGPSKIIVVNDSNVYQVNDTVIVDISDIDENRARQIANDFCKSRIPDGYYLETSCQPWEHEDENCTAWIFDINWKRN